MPLLEAGGAKVLQCSVQYRLLAAPLLLKIVGI